MHILPGHEKHLRGFSLDVVSKSGNTCLAIDGDNTIFFYNDAYTRFAQENEGEKILTDWALGANILDAIQGPQRDFYEEFFAQCLQSNAVQTFDYECSSPDTYRLLKMFAYPLRNSQGLLLDHCYIVIKEMKRDVSCSSPHSYEDKHGLVHQCGHCRRTMNIERNSWDWCPNLLSHKRVSHALCVNCLDFYYPAEDIQE